MISCESNSDSVQPGGIAVDDVVVVVVVVGGLVVDVVVGAAVVGTEVVGSAVVGSDVADVEVEDEPGDFPPEFELLQQDRTTAPIAISDPILAALPALLNTAMGAGILP
jgi:hypothetical protein